MAAEELGPAMFEPAVGSGFVTTLADGSDHTIVLESCTRLAPVPGLPRAEPFTLLFTGPPGGHMPQHSAKLRHPDLGELVIFIVPIGPRPDDGRQQYEAVFN